MSSTGQRGRPGRHWHSTAVTGGSRELVIVARDPSYNEARATSDVIVSNASGSLCLAS